MENENLNAVPKSNIKNIIAITVIILLFLGLLFVTFSYFNSPKKRFIDSINKLYSTLINKEANHKINNILSNNIVSVEGETTINLSGMDESLEAFDKTVFKYNYTEDKEAKKASINFDSSINNEKLLTLYGLAKDNKFYFKLKNLIDKYYFIEYNFAELLNAKNQNDSRYVMNIIKDTIIDDLDNKYFSKSSTSIKIDDKDKKVEKMTFEFTDKLIGKMITDFATKIKNDDKAINIMTNYSNMTKKEIIEQLDEIIDNAKEIHSNQKYKFNMYVKDYAVVVKYELIIDEVKIEYYDYKDIKEFSISANDIKYININMDENKKISGNIMGTIPFEGTYDKNKLDLKVNYLTTVFNLNVKTDETFKADSYNSDVKIEIKVSESNQEYLKLVIDSKNKLSKKDNIEEEKIDSSTDFNMISEEDQTTIMNKLMEIPIIQEIMGLSSTQNQINNSSIEYDMTF